jgi:hypothetical protein
MIRIVSPDPYAAFSAAATPGRALDPARMSAAGAAPPTAPTGYALRVRLEVTAASDITEVRWLGGWLLHSPSPPLPASLPCHQLPYPTPWSFVHAVIGLAGWVYLHAHVCWSAQRACQALRSHMLFSVAC